MDGFEHELIALIPRLRRMARMFAGQAADADDLVQTALERAYQNRDRWTPGSRLDSWIFRIMKNAWIDHVRHAGRAGRLFADDGALEAVADPSIAPMETRLAASAAERAFLALPDEQRLAVGLVLVEGLSYREAAEALDIPMGTLTSRLVRGRMALMAQLEGSEV